MVNAFQYFGGTTSEILFDNMKTIVDQVKSNFSDVVINNKAMQFSKDAGFKIVTCRPYRPRTKGKVETLAKIMNRLKAYDYEFENLENLELVVEQLNYELNYKENIMVVTHAGFIRMALYFNQYKQSFNLNKYKDYQHLKIENTTLIPLDEGV